MSPIDKFMTWYAHELQASQVKIPSACCLSTFGLDGYPNSRFVSLKEVAGEHFIITGPADSRKGQEILQNHKVALAFWWTATERQVRIQGEAMKLTEDLADKYFAGRSRASQIVNFISKQGQEISHITALEEQYLLTMEEMEGKDISRPENWSGFRIKPVRMEFMEFRETRLHLRELYSTSGNSWIRNYLQP